MRALWEGGSSLMYVDKARERMYWRHKELKRRCSPRAKPGDYERYHARGIRVCRQWLGRGGLQRFIDDVGMPPTPDHEIDRINNELGYEPGNVRWVLQVEQDANRRRSPRQLAPEVEEEIVAAIQHGATHVSQAKLYGIHPMTVTAILKRHAG